jgi:hypothetical protein
MSNWHSPAPEFKASRRGRPILLDYSSAIRKQPCRTEQPCRPGRCDNHHLIYSNCNERDDFIAKHQKSRTGASWIVHYLLKKFHELLIQFNLKFLVKMFPKLKPDVSVFSLDIPGARRHIMT